MSRMTAEHGTGGLAARQMPLIHRIFRRELPSLRTTVGEVPPTGVERARSVAGHLRFVLDGLHHHHTNEDEMVWPLLVDRVGLDAPLVERMAQQHGQIDDAMKQVRQAVDRGRRDRLGQRRRRSSPVWASSSRPCKPIWTRRRAWSCRSSTST